MKKLGLPLLIALFGVATLEAQSTTAVTARLVIRSGIVEVERANIWQPIAAGQTLNTGERVRTATGSIAAVEMGPGKVVTLNEQSQVQIVDSSAGPVMQLESGSMKVVSPSNIQVGAKDAVFQSAATPVDLELGYQADKLNLTVFNGAVQNGSVTVRGGNQDPTVRTYTAGSRPLGQNEQVVADPTYYVFPYFLYGKPDPTEGKIVPPVVNNPTHPAYRPTQIVPPMSDPLRVPVMKQ